MRVVIPGFINYNFKDGLRPGHTKPALNEYKIYLFIIIYIFHLIAHKSGTSSRGFLQQQKHQRYSMDQG